MGKGPSNLKRSWLCLDVEGGSVSPAVLVVIVWEGVEDQQPQRHQQSNDGPGRPAYGLHHPQCSRQNLPSKVMPSPSSLTCSATPDRTAACKKMPIAGFPGSSYKVEGVLLRVLPVGRTFCQRL